MIKMETTISVRLGEGLIKELLKIERKLQSDRSETIRRLLISAVNEWKIENALEELRQHKISIGKAAEDCAISKWEMIERAKEKNVDWIGYSEEDLKRDLELLE